MHVRFLPRNSAVRARTVGTFVAIELGLISAFALAAQDEDALPQSELPRAARPLTLPELTHPDPEATLESSYGLLGPSEGGRTPSRAVYVHRLSLEVPFIGRQWFVGANHLMGVAVPDGNVQAKPSSVELNMRAVWATRTGLAFGGGLGAIVPIPSKADEGRIAANLASTLLPWNYSLFSPQAVGVHPFADIRSIDGPFVVQFRQGIDWFALATDLNQGKLLAVTTLYLAYRATSVVTTGIEACEAYVVDGPVPDDRRSAFVLSPGVRFSTRYVQPAISGFANIGPTLGGEASSGWGARIAVTLVMDGAK